MITEIKLNQYAVTYLNAALNAFPDRITRLISKSLKDCEVSVFAPSDYQPELLQSLESPELMLRTDLDISVFITAALTYIGEAYGLKNITVVTKMIYARASDLALPKCKLVIEDHSVYSIDNINVHENIGGPFIEMIRANGTFGFLLKEFSAGTPKSNSKKQSLTFNGIFAVFAEVYDGENILICKLNEEINLVIE